MKAKGTHQADPAEEQLNDAKVTLVAEIAQSYIELRSTQAKLELLRRNRTLQQESVELIQELVSSGIVSDIDLQQARDQMGLYDAQRPLLDMAMDKAVHHLSILLGRYPGDLCCELSAPAGLPSLPMQIPIGTPAELLCRRPDIRKAERDLAAITERAGAHHLQACEAAYQYQKAILVAMEEVENNIASLHYAMERYEALSGSCLANRDMYELNQDLYTKGLKSYLEMQVAQRAYISAEEAFLLSHTELLLHYIALQKALGVGNS